MDAAFRRRALALGYNEAISLTFISHGDAERFSTGAHVLELENPLSEESSVMRTSLVPGMLDMLAWNLNRDVPQARLFEIGALYELLNGKRVEPRRACFGATLDAVRTALPANGALDVSKNERAAAGEAFRGFKGDIENLLATFAGEPQYEHGATGYYHAGRSARVLMNGVVVAEFGQIDPGLARDRKLRQDVFLAEIDLEQLYEVGLRPVKFARLGKYPAVERDFSFVFTDDVSFEQMKNSVTTIGISELREFRPVEIFRGGSIAAGKHSILLRVKFQSDERTLRDDEVAQWSAKMVEALTALGGSQRV
jgi:phenylalanyl-tRNA synthetase beta chain